MKPRGFPVIAVLAGAVAAAFALSLLAGSEKIPFAGVMSALFGGEGGDNGVRQIVLVYRLPKAVTAVLAGAALAMSGLFMQTLFRNPLADPFVLGISSGASLGVAVLVLASGVLPLGAAALVGVAGDLSVTAAAAAGAAAAFLLVLAASRAVRSNVTLLILGMLFGYGAGAMVSVLMQFSSSHRLQAYILWTFGSFGGVTWGQLLVLLPISAAAVAAGFPLLKPLNALLLGEGYARSMGVKVGLCRAALVCVASLLTGAVTAFCGPIAFIGIAVPHLCRAVFKSSDHRVLLPACLLAGALAALLADLATQLPGEGRILPLNAVTSLFGAPVVIAAILRRKDALEAAG